jgi:hypothetical protein
MKNSAFWNIKLCSLLKITDVTEECVISVAVFFMLVSWLVCSSTLRRKATCFFLFVRWDFGYCGHYWPIVPTPGDSDGDCGEIEE